MNTFLLPFYHFVHEIIPVRLDEATQPPLLLRLTETPSPRILQHIDPVECTYEP